MKVTQNAVQNSATSANNAKQLKAASKKLFDIAVQNESADDLAYDKDGNLLTNAMFFNGMPRPAKGSGKKVKIADTKKGLVPAKYAKLSNVLSLQKQATAWNDVVYKTASEQLYNLLAQVYLIIKDLYTVESDEKVLRKDLKEFAAKMNITVKSSTSVVGILVSCVFKQVPRQRRCAYSIGLQNLIDSVGLEADADAVANAIEEAGGIYELAKPYKDPAQNEKTGADSKRYLLNSVKAAKVCTTNDKKIAAVLVKENVQYVLVATRLPDGTVAINNVIEDDALVLTVARKIKKQKNSPKKVKSVKSKPVAKTKAAKKTNQSSDADADPTEIENEELEVMA